MGGGGRLTVGWDGAGLEWLHSNPAPALRSRRKTLEVTLPLFHPLLFLFSHKNALTGAAAVFACQVVAEKIMLVFYFEFC